MRQAPAFWRDYNKLPRSIQQQADRQFALLKDNPRHPSYDGLIR